MLRKILIGLGSTTSIIVILSLLWYLFARFVLEFLTLIISLLVYLVSSVY